jgi:hypothetical protein
MLLIVNIVILLLFVIGYVYSLNKPQEWMKDIDKKDHKLYILYPMSDLFISKTGLGRILSHKNKITDSMKALYITNKPELLQKLFWCSRVALIIAIFILFDLLSLLGQISSEGELNLLENKYLVRPDYGEGNAEVALDVTARQTKSNEPNDELDIFRFPDVIINVKERMHTQEEMEAVFKEAIRYLEEDLLGDNASKELIYSNLNFSEEIPGTSITVEWKPEDSNLIMSDGTVSNEEVATEGINTTVKMVLSYYDQKVEHNVYLRIMPKLLSEEDILIKKLEDAVMAAAKDSKVESQLELPLTLDNYHISWQEKEGNNGLSLLLLGIFIAILVWIIVDKELEKQLKKRKEQMLLDYPEIINKFTLLVNAGMTVKQAWYKIATDYSDKYVQNSTQKRYAYEEMLATSRELKLGLPENVAYEQYGRRIGLIPYIKFGSFISQNLKKGNKGFTELLMKEAEEAFEERKEIAKRLGEEAGTKLLIPMMIMLIIVFLIIMIPAFWSFRV